jgi:uncharacterized Zn finger protein
MTLTEAVQRVVTKHGGIRAAERATGVDKGFMSRLLRGLKTAPRAETLTKLGLRSVPLYEAADECMHPDCSCPSKERCRLAPGVTGPDAQTFSPQSPMGEK